MRLAAILLVLAALPLPAQRRARERPSGRLNPLGRSEEAIAEGRTIYNRTCTICHGLDGAAGDRGPALAGTRRYLRASDEDLYDAIRSGIPGTAMPPSGLSETDAWKVTAYIRSLRATASDAFVKGDPVQGGKIFWSKGQCGDCHTIRGKGGLLGPDLSNVGGQRTLSYIQDALTKPRPQIPRGYQPARIVTSDGRSLSGIIKNENNFSVQFLDIQQKLHLFTRDELREVVYDKQSLMPGDYGKRLAPAELQDLLAFLSRQATGRTRPEPTDDEDP